MGVNVFPFSVPCKREGRNPGYEEPFQRRRPSVNICHKKVLLRERKRHTARRVASTPYVVLTGYPPSGYPPGQGTPPWPGYPPGQGTPPQLDLAGYPLGWTWQGTPPAAPWHSGKCCKALWDMGTPPVDKLTK